MVARDAVRRAQHKPLVITVAEQQRSKLLETTITAARLQDASVNPKMIANVRAAPVDPIMTTSRHHRSQRSELENRIPNPTSGHLERVCNSRRRREVEMKPTCNLTRNAHENHANPLVFHWFYAHQQISCFFRFWNSERRWGSAVCFEKVTKSEKVKTSITLEI